MKKVKALSITIPGELTEKLHKISKAENKSVSFVISEAVMSYCGKKELEEARAEFSERARKMGVVSEEDIDRVIHEYRQERKSAKNHR
ncbi:MAG: hypothetical protein BWY84_00206 [Candidatus Aerophobetes bacterium ADurb.Bin490]|jgi:predicted transcriptional regulator|nr:MAG: hypothetical protein BWY84_00206 [Candidatus Aerophobetes bacterium ADurb.Bin490]HNZ30160.1 hypothetical protein [Candidatus Goldiibacteriota bacterium]HPN64504.1 hypothetical protein [Candidatus Goldiibacteriota bacterium]HRQ44124.1 hypothetical protein [Candidatus Goldiibacteriota bacterium]